MKGNSKKKRRIVSRKSRVQSSKKNFELLRPRGLLVLEKLGAGEKASDVARDLGCGKSLITYWKNKLIKIAALRLKCKDVYNTYELTDYGSTILTRSERFATGEVVVLEDHAMKFGVVEDEEGSIDWVKLGEPRNWVKLGVKLGGVRVVKTTRSVIIHPGRLKGFDVDALLLDSGRIIERVKSVLEDRFGMVLSISGVPLHKPVLRFYSDEAKELVKEGTTIVEGVGSVDNSPPEKRPHEEFFGKKLAKERLMMPLRLRSVQSQLDVLHKGQMTTAGEVKVLRESQIMLTKNMDTLTKNITKFVKLLGASQERLASNQERNEQLLWSLGRKLSRRRRRPAKPKKKPSRWQKFRKRLSF